MAPAALVTGSSSGTGRVIALRPAADGVRVLPAGIRREPLTGGEPTDDVIARGGRPSLHATAQPPRTADG